MSSLTEVFTPKQIETIKRVDALLPDRQILDHFNHYSFLAPAARLDAAEKDVDVLPRQGLIRVGIPKHLWQTVGQHQKNLSKLVGVVAEMYGLDKRTKKRGQRLAKVHDLPEVIASDITPYDGISAGDKSELETLAAELIFAAHPKKLDQWREYQEGKTKVSLLVHKLDKVEMLLDHVIRVGESLPDRRRALADEFVGSAESYVRKGVGLRVLKELKELIYDGAPSQTHTRMRGHYKQPRAAA